ncbi:MAG TPA: DUF1080 domain-containing protein, partial [Gemmatales bacterium]|nr:DUF1080 domain-containing protein [Gemmatales bacterium]
MYLLIVCLLLNHGCFGPGLVPEDGWQDLTGSEGFAAWRASGTWYRTEEVHLKAGNPRLLEARPTGGPILVNSTTGRTVNLISKEKFRDVEFSCDFMMAEKSNAGIKFIGHYEIQLFDSYGKPQSELTGSDCGGVYPRGEGKPRYHVIDRGTPPRENVCRKPGEWQTIQITFRAPRFDGTGRKV